VGPKFHYNLISQTPQEFGALHFHINPYCQQDTPHCAGFLPSLKNTLRCSIVFLDSGAAQRLMFVHQRVRRMRPDRPPEQSGKEVSMELKMRLNVLAAIMSFTFLAAVVLGMI
jgi:hypothetical protein